MPVVAVHPVSITRDPSRVFNKIDGLVQKQTQTSSPKIPAPVPVDVTINMSIMTRYQEDMEQILSNFVPYTNPYLIISWKLPETLVSGNNTEIRSKVLWSENIQLNYPIEQEPSNTTRIEADTSFTIKGWLWPENEDNVKNIYTIYSNFYAISGLLESLDTMNQSPMETVVVSGRPIIYDSFYKVPNGGMMTVSEVNLPSSTSHTFHVYGDNFDFTSTYIISSDNNSLLPSLTATGSDYETISGYAGLTVQNLERTKIYITTPPLSAQTIKLVAINPAGIAATDDINIV